LEKVNASILEKSGNLLNNLAVMKMTWYKGFPLSYLTKLMTFKSKLALASQPSAVATEMRSFQLQVCRLTLSVGNDDLTECKGLKWMLDKEFPQLPKVGSKEVVQLWQRVPANPAMVTNLATNFTMCNETPPLASGGILADDMGLGKTLQVISLIVGDTAYANSSFKPDIPKVTLIIAPLTVMSNWSSQVRNNSNPFHFGVSCEGNVH
jgi:SNF2 family DNA or RNA helicase